MTHPHWHHSPFNSYSNKLGPLVRFLKWTTYGRLHIDKQSQLFTKIMKSSSKCQLRLRQWPVTAVTGKACLHNDDLFCGAPAWRNPFKWPTDGQPRLFSSLILDFIEKLWENNRPADWPAVGAVGRVVYEGSKCAGCWWWSARGRLCGIWHTRLSPPFFPNVPGDLEHKPPSQPITLLCFEDLLHQTSHIHLEGCGYPDLRLWCFTSQLLSRIPRHHECVSVEWVWV